MSVQCLICQSHGAQKRPTSGDYTSVSCKQCGEVKAANSALARLESLSAQQRAKLSAWVRQNEVQFVSFPQIDEATSVRSPGLIARAERMLRFVAESFGPGKNFSYYDFSYAVEDGRGGQCRPIANPLLSVGWNLDEAEAQYMLRTVLRDELGLLGRALPGDDSSFFVSPRGLLHLERPANLSSAVGFCAMWFDSSVLALYIDVIAPAIRESGYEPLRIDNKEHTNKIDDKIVASIRASRFVVADYTGNRGGVYYEAGFAHGLGLPVFFMARDGEKLHFDVRQYNTIFWKTDDFAGARERLKNRILATLGRGPLKTS